VGLKFQFEKIFKLIVAVWKPVVKWKCFRKKVWGISVEMFVEKEIWRNGFHGGRVFDGAGEIRSEISLMKE
jgi:hypothetical protein